MSALPPPEIQHQVEALEDLPRLALTAQYCRPWLRPREAFTLSTSRDTVHAVSEDIRRMLGYSIHPPFMGMVNGMHPKRLLDNHNAPAE